MDPILMVIAYAMGISMVLGAMAGWSIFLFLLVREGLLPRLRNLRLNRQQAPRIPALER